jgi:uncharacterized protein (DUF1800 family)
MKSTLQSLVAIALVVSFVPYISAQKPKVARTPRLTEEQRIAHVLSRITFGARPGDIERVRTLGIEAFINQQLEWDAIEDNDMARRLRFPTLGLAQPNLIAQYTPPKPTPSPTPAATVDDKKAANIPLATDKPENSAQMMAAGEMNKPAEDKPAPKPTPSPKNAQMVVTELQRATLLRAVYSERQLYEVMVGFWENHFSIYVNKDANRYLMTSFDRDTIRPFAMGRFRDLLRATAYSPAMLFYLDNWRSSVPRPYAATKDKPAGVDGGINENYARELLELHTLGVDGGYTQKDVQEVARCFTGWTIQKPNEDGLFLYRPGLHDNGEKIVLGKRILPGGGIADGEKVLEILASHPATARHVATKLTRRFISDDPPEAVIKRAAAVFLKTDGSIRETLKSILTAPEFFSPAYYRAKLRSPFEYVAASLRALKAETDADRALLDTIGRMGQPIFGRVSPDGYADRADQWLSAGAMLARFNFANALVTNRVKGTKVDFQLINGDLVVVVLAGDISKETREALSNASQGNITDVYSLLLGSPEFQRR